MAVVLPVTGHRSVTGPRSDWHGRQNVPQALRRAAQKAGGGVPTGVLAGESYDQGTDRVTDRRSTGAFQVRPVPSQEASVPGQQRRWGDDPMLA
ncbi:hypothetical protein [Plantactinospora sp. DSM 117369]